MRALLQKQFELSPKNTPSRDYIKRLLLDPGDITCKVLVSTGSIMIFLKFTSATYTHTFQMGELIHVVAEFRKNEIFKQAFEHYKASVRAEYVTIGKMLLGSDVEFNLAPKIEPPKPVVNRYTCDSTPVRRV